MHPPAHPGMGQKQSVPFLAYSSGFFSAQRLAAPSQMAHHGRPLWTAARDYHRSGRQASAWM
jgi:hypothetical protein